MQFSIRSLLLVILAFAIFLGMAQTAGYAVAAGIVVAISLLVWAAAWRRRGAFLYSRIGAAVFSLVAIWFLAVDWSWFVVDCPDCCRFEDLSQYRVLGIPVYTQVYAQPSNIERILNDLGAPCDHINCRPWHKYRFWGLVLPACPFINGTILSEDDPSGYTVEMAARVRHVCDENPRLRAELRALLVKKHDYRAFWKKIDDSTAYLPDEAE